MSEAFRQTHWTRLPHGSVEDPDFRDELRGELPSLYDNLMAWIAEDDGTGMYGAEIKWALRDLVHCAVTPRGLQWRRP